MDALGRSCYVGWYWGLRMFVDALSRYPEGDRLLLVRISFSYQFRSMSTAIMG